MEHKIDEKFYKIQNKEMLELDLKKAGVAEIADVLGLTMPLVDFVECFNNEEKQNEFFQNQEEITQSRQSLIRYIKQNERFIDKPGFIFLNYLYLTEEIKYEDRSINKNIREKDYKIKKIREYLEQEPTIIIRSDYDKLNMVLYDSRDYVPTKKERPHAEEKEDALKQLEEISKEISLKTLLFLQYMTDVENIYGKFPEIGIMIRSNAISSTYFKDNKKIEEVHKYLSGEKEANDRPYSDFIPEFLKGIVENAEYIDIDKMLLMSAYRATQSLNKKISTDEDNKFAIEVLKKCYKLIKNERTQIKGEIEFEDEENKVIKYTYKDLEKDIEKRIINGRYYGNAEIETIKKLLLLGQITVADIHNKEIIELMALKNKEKNELMEKSVENAIDLYTYGAINEKQLRENMINRKLTAENIAEVIDEKILSSGDIINLYLKENIELEDTLRLKEFIKDDLKIEKLIEQYRNIEFTEDEEERKKLEKYISLFREMVVNEATPEERETIGDEIVLELGEKMTEEEITDLYRRNLIPIKTLEEWNGDIVVSKMFSQGLLKPTDAREFVDTGKIDIKTIKKDILSRNLSDEEKMALIFSLFDGENEEEIREELLQTLRISDDENNYQKNVNNVRTRGTGTSSNKKRIINIMDPCYKLNLLKKLDKDYIYTLTSDGHMILELPKLNQVIIEKMFTRNGNSVEVAVGAATYVLDIDAFHSSNIIQSNNKIDRSKLNEMRKEETATRYYHSKNWGSTIKNAFNIETSEMYTEQDKKEIDSIIERIKRTRRIK